MGAQDLEVFLFDFISDQAAAGAFQYAKELHSRFQPWVFRPLWWDFLAVHWSSNEEAIQLFTHLLRQMNRQKDRELLFEILHYLSEHTLAGFFDSFLQIILREELESGEREELALLIEAYLAHHEGPNQWQIEILDLLKQKASSPKTT